MSAGGAERSVRPPSPRRAEFEALYRGDPDPWGMETSAYEAEKYGATLDALSRPRYGAALEIGCSIGVLTARLAARCDRLVAVDVSDTALARARARPGTEAVEWRRAEVPAEWPTGCYDLIVLSEVLYFLEPDEVRAVAALVAGALAPGGEAIVVNWLGECDRTLDGRAASELFMTEARAHGLEGDGVRTAPRYRIDRTRRTRSPQAPPARDV